MRKPFLVFMLLLVPALAPLASAAENTAAENTAAGDRLLGEYFRAETQKLSDAAFADIDSLEDWTSRRETYRSELLEMLGLDPLPPRGPLQAQTTGVTEQQDVVVENITFQSLPGLYVTGNLYRPRQQDQALPAVLYVCGHGRVVKDGISYGNKTHYQHHGAWFARNGYVCLTIDTIQLGELEGIHHGTYREKMWWWNNRGYTPAGVEAWNGMRAIDYLQSRDDVDGQRIGVTGRSGGGAYSWYLAAIDERIRVAVPVAGITNLQNHVVDGCVTGHCDCMYMVNTYRWDYAKLAALVAPRPLLISNTDRDPIFPLEGVIDVHAKVRRIYDLYGASENLGLQITSGPHQDTQELRVHAFRWFNRYLRNDESLLETVATKFFEPQQLKVFEQLPTDQRVTTIHESFVPAVSVDSLPSDASALQDASAQWLDQLQSKTFRGWPDLAAEPLDVQIAATATRAGTRVRAIDYTSQSPYRLQLFIVQPATDAAGDAANTTEALDVVVVDQHTWPATAAALAQALPESFPGIAPSDEAWQTLTQRGSAIAFIIPRGVGPTEWSREEPARTHIRRRFMLLGQTAASMQIFDVVRALGALDKVEGLESQNRHLSGSGEASVWALYASLFAPRIDHLQLLDLPIQNRDAPDLLNVSRFVEMPHVLLLASQRAQQVSVGGHTQPQWKALADTHAVLAPVQWLESPSEDAE